jgi:hypothetical protein
MEIVQQAGEKFAEVVKLVGKHYVNSMIANAFRPALEDGLKQLSEEAKEALGKAEKKIEDDLPADPEEKEKDTFLINIDSCEVKETRYETKFMVYDTYVIRIGNKGEEKKLEFYVNAQHYQVKYPVLRRGTELVAKDFKDFKVPAFPAQYEFGGTCCFCMTKQPGDKPAHLAAVQSYYTGLFDSLPGYSDKLATHFRVGNEFEAQQAARDVFVEAYKAALDELGVSVPSNGLTPYNEKEALSDLLQAVAERDFLPKMREAMPVAAVYNGARNALLGAIDKAVEPFDAVMEKASEASTKVTKKVQDSAAAIVDELRPAIKRIVELIQSKMGSDEKEEKEEKKEKKGMQVGDVAKNWKFIKTNVGKKLGASFDGKEKPGAAVKGTVDEIKGALRAGIKEPLDKLAVTLGGGGNKFIMKQVQRLTDKLVDLILTITTLDGFMESSVHLAGVVDTIEDNLAKCAGDAEKLKKEIDLASALLWKEGVIKVAMTLFIKIFKLQEDIQRVLSGQPEEAVTTLVELLGHIFEVQLRAFNGIRVEYIRNLHKTVTECKDADAVVTASRAAFKQAVFPVLDLLAYFHWTTAYEAFEKTAKIIVLNAFDTEVWPTIKSGCDAIQEAIPKELGDMGLQITPVVRNIANLMINAGVAILFKTVYTKIEVAVFTQEGGSYE